MIVLNLKTYPTSFEKALYFCDISTEVVEESGVRIIVCPPQLIITESSERYSNVFAQHCDDVEQGAFTGTIPAAALHKYGVKGSLVNHSEHRIPLEKIKSTIEKLQQNTLEALVCAENEEEIKKIAQFKPNYIAIEPPELIGTGISVSNAKPELIKKAIDALKAIHNDIPLLCGAGVSNRQDTENAVKIGADGVLLASAFVKAKDHKEFLRELASVF